MRCFCSPFTNVVSLLLQPHHFLSAHLTYFSVCPCPCAMSCSFSRFAQSKVKKVAQDILDKRLKEVEAYDPERCSALSREICTDVQQQLKGSFALKFAVFNTLAIHSRSHSSSFCRNAVQFLLFQ